MINILFTCAGRRNYLINYFKDALNGRGQTIAIDSQITAPAMVDADIAIKVPSIYHKDYITKLKEIIKTYNVTAIISLNDLELPILSEYKEVLEKLGTKVLISNTDTIDIAFDKWRTYTFFKSINVKTPKTYLTINETFKALDDKDVSFPLVVKPRWGSASIGIDIVENKEELLLSYKLQKIKLKKSILVNASSKDIEQSILIQEKINGDEYGVDILNNFKGEYYNSFIRKKLAMRSGETDKAKSIIDTKFSKVCEVIGENTKHIGNMDCDFFVYEGEVFFLEMNPRFGGGYPFSHEAGINTPAIYIEWLLGSDDIEKHNNFERGLAFSKCDRIIPIPSI